VDDDVLGLLDLAAVCLPAGADLISIIGTSGQRRRGKRAYRSRLPGLGSFEPDLRVGRDLHD
jgi:hypothetical protein